MPEFTDAQKRAINESGRTLLISAAAGSGKTTTLTERIIRSICRAEDPTPLDRLLVVTFTKESAADLRARISRALEAELAKDGANAFLAHQITLLPSAKIGTIDSFLLNLVKQNYAALGLSPSFRMADEAENAAIAAAQMEALLDDCYDNPSSTLCGGPEGFASLVGLLCGIKSDGQLSEILLSLYEKLDAYPRGAAALSRSVVSHVHIPPPSPQTAEYQSGPAGDPAAPHRSCGLHRLLRFLPSSGAEGGGRPLPGPRPDRTGTGP